MSVYLFLFKHQTAYSMLRSLVASEICIRDSLYSSLESRKDSKAPIDYFRVNDDIRITCVREGSILRLRRVGRHDQALSKPEPQAHPSFQRAGPTGSLFCPKPTLQ